MLVAPLVRFSDDRPKCNEDPPAPRRDRADTSTAKLRSGSGKGTPWLSILIPVYNVEPYLAECLASVYDQILDDPYVEVLILDDCSTDTSAEVAATFARVHGTRTRLLFHSENRGLSASRNSLLEAATGSYVWFIDSDDKLTSNAIASLREAVETSSADLILCDYRRSSLWRRTTFHGPSRRVGKDCEKLVRGVFSASRLHSWSKISRRSLWKDDLRFPVGRCFEDISTTPRLLLRAETYFYVPRAWIFYRRRADSIMDSLRKSQKTFDTQKNDDLALALEGFIEELREKLPALGPGTSYAIASFVGARFAGLIERLTGPQSQHNSREWVLRRVLLYKRLSEDASPLPMSKLPSYHLRRLRLSKWLKLRSAMAFANRAS